MRSTLRIAVFLFGIVAPAVGFAQPAATPPPEQKPPPPRFEGSAELSLVAASGNTDVQSCGLSRGIIWRPGIWTTRARAPVGTAETAGIETARSTNGWIRQASALSTAND